MSAENIPDGDEYACLPWCDLEPEDAREFANKGYVDGVVTGKTASASEATAGIARFGTEAEVAAGGLANVMVSPANLAKLTATEDRAGIIQIASPDDVTSEDKAVSPAGMASMLAAGAKTYVFDTTSNGSIPIIVPVACEKINVIGFAMLNNIWNRNNYNFNISITGSNQYTLTKSGGFSGSTGQPEFITYPLPLAFAFDGPFAANQAVTLTIGWTAVVAVGVFIEFVK